MKKTMILLLGALIASVLPGTGLKAQSSNKVLRLKIETIDKAAIASPTSAVLYRTNSNADTLCIDPTNPDLFTYTGSATAVTTLNSYPLIVESNDSVSALVFDNGMAYGVVVISDVNGRYYVLGNADTDMLEQGIFRAAALFADTDTLVATLRAQTHMLRASAASNATVATDGSFLYTTLNNAVNLSTLPNITLTADIPALTPCEINRPLNLFMGSNKIPGTLSISADSTVYIEGTTGSVIGLVNTDDVNDGLIRINGVDSIGGLGAGSTHPWEIQYARVSNIIATPAAQITIFDGKFNQTSAAIIEDNFMAPNRFLYRNTDTDAAYFKWKVGNSANGYRVEFRNYNPTSTDPDSVAFSAGGLIIPAVARPTSVPSEYLFQHFYVDAAYTTPWHFDTSHVTKDTVLYTKWQYFDPTTLFRLTVRHLLRNLDGETYDTVDVEEYGVLRAGTDDTMLVSNNLYLGFTRINDTIYVPRLGSDAVAAFFYERNSYTLTWDFRYADVTYDTPFATVVTYLYDEPIVFPTNLNRPGYHFVSWSLPYTTMPFRNLTLSPVFEKNNYHVLWNGPDTVPYNALDQLGNITAALTSSYDTVFLTPADLVVTNKYGDTVPEAITAADGPYTIKAVPDDTNFRRDYYTARSLVIRPCEVNAIDIDVEKVRLYEQGNQNAVVISNGRPDQIKSNAAGVIDDLFINPVTARFSDEEPGENKVITAYGITLGGAQADNYVLIEDTLILSREGVILYFGLNDTLVGGFDSDFKGYCNDNSYQVEFHLDEGATNPDMYALDYESDLFTDVISATINQSGFVDIVIPDGTPAGVYNVDVVFWSSRYPAYKSPAQTFSFIVNLDKDVIMPIFDDVMTVMNADPNMRIDTTSVTWFNSTDNGTTWDTVRNADSSVFHGAFIQPEGGLNGLYYVEFTYTDSNGVSHTARSCAQENIEEYPAAPAKATVKAYPNPTVNTVNITVENSTMYTHTLRVMNVMGVTLLNTTFNGDVTSIDFSRLGVGSYTVSVDGIVVRVIKK